MAYLLSLWVFWDCQKPISKEKKQNYYYEVKLRSEGVLHSCHTLCHSWDGGRIGLFSTSGSWEYSKGEERTIFKESRIILREFSQIIIIFFFLIIKH